MGELSVIYDTLSYVTRYENGVLVEGYDGFKLVEKNGDVYVVYKGIKPDGSETQRRFSIGQDGIEQFIKLRELYQFDMKVKFLDFAVKQVQSRGMCFETVRQVYEENKRIFAAINMTQAEFFSYVNGRIPACAS